MDPTQMPPAPLTKRTSFPFSAAIFGVILPLATLIIEFFTGWCTELFFDPIPTYVHVILVALVPVGNAILIYQLWRPGENRSPILAGWLNGIAAAVALFYAIVFLPMSPFAVLGIAFFGIGLMPLSPLFSFIAALRLRRKFRLQFCQQSTFLPPAFWKPLVIIFVILLAMEAPKVMTHAGIRMAVSSESKEHIRGLKLLRTFGQNDLLLKFCYSFNRPFNDLTSFLFEISSKSVTAADAQKAYYQVTGIPYNAVKPPEMRGIRSRGTALRFDEWDFAQGGDAVATRVRDLFLQESRLDAIVTPDACTSYTEWTLIFKNDSVRQAEARAQVLLPPGGVVSRLTLWIDNEEREAAYGGRSQVKDAYKKVVQRRRDPVLVTTCGPDQVLLQCFPVPPNGGTMKVKMGITAPLVLESYESGLLRMPMFLLQNFSMTEGKKHSVWLESGTEITAPNRNTTIKMEKDEKTGRYVARGLVEDDSLSKIIAVRIKRNPEALTAWEADTRSGKGFVSQSIQSRPTITPSKLVVVIDGSMRMQLHAETIADALNSLPPNIDISIILASDEVKELLSFANQNSKKATIDGIKHLEFAGGCDNVPALLEAWNIASKTSDGSILWLHATQPVDISEVEGLIQCWERRPDRPLLFDYQFGSGPNLVIEKLDGVRAVNRVQSFGDPKFDMAGLFNEWKTGNKLYVLERNHVNKTKGGVESGDLNIVRLWAKDEILKLASTRKNADRDAAIAMAHLYQLVTPVSGAVVLENQQQYKEAGLAAADPADSPSVVPEPETWALLFAGFVVLLLYSAKNRHAFSKT